MAHDELARHFAAAPSLFPTSPLYGRLGAVVADDERLMAIAAEARPGQLPSTLLFAAVHYLLLRDPSHDLAAWYPTAGSPRTPEGDPGPAFTDFCLTRRAQLVEVVRHRLVQTNVVKRAMALRLGLAAIAAMTDEPVTLIELGCSAGLLLRFDEYRYDLGGRTWGRPGSPVEVRTEWRGPGSAPDLEPLPSIADRAGVDLHPVDVTDPDERLWLRALIWPENRAQADLQDAALRVVAADPPRTVAGDAVEMLARLVSEVPRDRPVVVFHAATRLHVPADRLGEFDAAIAAVRRTHALFHLSFEVAPRADQVTFALRLWGADGRERLLGTAESHAEWMAGPGTPTR
jgi:hypothetical protein